MTINEKYQQARKSGAPVQNNSYAKPEPAKEEPKADVSHKAAAHGKGWIYCLAVLAIIFIVAAISCPKEAEHRAAVTPVVTSLVEHKLCEFMGDDIKIEDLKKDEFDQKLLATITAKPVEKIMDNFFMSNHVVYSIGYLTIQDRSMKISIGFFGKVFVLDQLEDSFVSEWDLFHSILDLGNF